MASLLNPGLAQFPVTPFEEVVLVKAVQLSWLSGSDVRIKLVLMAVFLLGSAQAFGQEISNPEPFAVVELGVAPSRNLKKHASSFGPTVAVELSPIEKWLELEAGVTTSFGRRSTEWTTDLLFKKPWTLSPKVEFMAGIGPEWIHTRESGMTKNSVGGEAVADFMFWPGRKHKFGWYLEPGYEYNFGRGRERSIGMSIGLLVAINKR